MKFLTQYLGLKIHRANLKTTAVYVEPPEWPDRVKTTYSQYAIVKATVEEIMRAGGKKKPKVPSLIDNLKISDPNF